MSVNTFHLIIASVSEAHFDGPARSATFPGSDGELTVLARHEPFVTTLRKGVITLRDERGSKEFPVESGVLEVSGNRAVVLL